MGCTNDSITALTVYSKLMGGDKELKLAIARTQS